MKENHSHTHSIDISSLNRAFLIGIVLNILFVITEFGIGVLFDSLALLSDAGHNFSDVISLVLALLAFRLAKVKANNKFTYGYKKCTILVSLLNAIILIIAVIFIIVESIEKLRFPTEVSGYTIAWVAGIGVFINGYTAFLFTKDKDKDLNIKGAYLHMAADALVSVGVLLSGLIIKWTGLYIIDPIIGIIVAVVILLSTFRLLRDSIRLSLDGVPVNIDTVKIKELIKKIPGIKKIYHIHIWGISTTESALTAHVVVDDFSGVEYLKEQIRNKLADEGINHVTLEFETILEKCTEECERNS